MNRNSLEGFTEQASALKMPAALRDEIIKQMEANHEKIEVTHKIPSRKGYLEATVHLKRGAGDSEFYFLNKYDLAWNSKVKPLENDYTYMVKTEVINGDKAGKPLLRAFESPIRAIEYFNLQKGNSELFSGKKSDKKLLVGQSLATMKDGKVDYVTKDFQATFRNPLIKNTIYLKNGAGFNLKQSANMLQGGSAHRDDLVSRQGVQYEAWCVYKFDEPRDNYGNLKIRQFGTGYPFKLEDELRNYKIHGLDDPKIFSDLVASLKDGERTWVKVAGPDGESQNMLIDAVPRYGNINFYNPEGKAPVMREDFLKNPLDQKKTFSNKTEQSKENSKAAGIEI